MNHAFEDIEVKINAPLLLEDALRRKRKRCVIATGSMSDPYQPCEKTLMLMRQCLKIIDSYNFGVSIITKSDLILRDIDLLLSINAKAKCVVQMTITTADENVCRIVEPGVCTTKRRAEVLQILHEHGIPTIVWLCPLLPFINDSWNNIARIIEYCCDTGVYGIVTFGLGLTLREGDREYFYKNIDAYFPGLQDRYSKIYGMDYILPIPEHETRYHQFQALCDKNHLIHDTQKLFTYLSDLDAKDESPQLELF
jgi:DNA repair photolyase